MNWHETIEFIREKEEYKSLVQEAYLDRNLELNVQRFGASEEFKATLDYIKKYLPNCKSILDIGAGNGISSVNFALNGFNVSAVEPDPSDSVGAKAIEYLKEKYQLSNLKVYSLFAENINFPDESFDLVYVRQAMHHAYELNKFIKESARVLIKGGILFTVRDHVITGEKDKELFFKFHPLHKYYGGENAFTSTEYRNAMTSANLTILEELKYYDSVINYSPLTKDSINNLPQIINDNLKTSLIQKVRNYANNPLIFWLYKLKNGYIRKADYYNESRIPGRIYSYLAIKK